MVDLNDDELEHDRADGIPDRVDGEFLKAWGVVPGPELGVMLGEIRLIEAEHARDSAARKRAVEEYLIGRAARMAARAEEERRRVKPFRDASEAVTVIQNIRAESAAEKTNLDAVLEAMSSIARTPTVTAAAVMPDACPAGASMPVGGVAAAEGAIHPGWHSADICCSLFASNFGGADPKRLLDAVFGITHFGPGGRKEGDLVPLPEKLERALKGGNSFLRNGKIQHFARTHMATQGDGNHFAFVGTSENSGDTWLVTHHGSRGAGAALYKLGMIRAEGFRRKLSPGTPPGNAWIPHDTPDGADYWEALQFIREWTRRNHASLHELAALELGGEIFHRRWNEHNFVFRDGDVFWHGKGATPIHDPFLPDTDGTQIVPMTMGDPILFVRGERDDRNLGFAPHGAGRNMSRTRFRKKNAHRTDEEIFAEETRNIDARFWCGKIDISELPSAYKDARKVRDQMLEFGLAEIVDRVTPFGTIMAGDLVWDGPRRKNRGR